MPEIDVDALRMVAQELPGIFVHQGDCGGTLCGVCGHCEHSIVTCDHDCDESGGGCADAIDTSEVMFRRDVLALLDRLQAAEGAAERVRALASRWQQESDERPDPNDPLMLFANGVAGMLDHAIGGSDR